ncbi:MAG: 3-oxoacyl-[acyl-carrier-protein] reductase [Gemmatimonadota bacterium]|nr:3-oxoacyl-[acyl-carrier-protein] reductase [Gemmatimonadota bacterium]MDH4347633.1 3-oxoacyl-[acyl-carrier-protein] reductase [Gemmatimonadota bacterium]
MQIDLNGQVAFVTGSTRGIGRAVAAALYQAGAKVAVVGRDAARAESVARELGERAVGVGCNVSDGAQVEAAVGAAEKSLGPITILVNNAGITRDNLLLRMSEAEWDDVMQANLKGAFHTTKAVLRGMMKRRQGRIINISSIIGIVGNKGQANYAASKAGLIAFTKSVAKEYGSRGILANAVAPGFIETDMTGGLPEEARQAMLGGVTLGRFGAPADVAGAVLFLASDLAGYITGQTLVVDGGIAV